MSLSIIETVAVLSATFTVVSGVKMTVKVSSDSTVSSSINITTGTH